MKKRNRSHETKSKEEEEERPQSEKGREVMRWKAMRRRRSNMVEGEERPLGGGKGEEEEIPLSGKNEEEVTRWEVKKRVKKTQDGR